MEQKMFLDKDRETLRNLVEEYGLQAILEELGKIAGKLGYEELRQEFSKKWKQQAQAILTLAFSITDAR
jgi:hypothetical protein